MKRVSVIGLILILFVLSGHAQNSYSKQNLQQASKKDLNVLLEKAKQNRTIGMVFTGVGVASVASMFILNETTGGISFETAGILLFGGSIIALIGLPLLIINSSRINKITNVLSDRVFIEIAPFSFQSPMVTQNYQPGVTLRMRF